MCLETITSGPEPQAEGVGYKVFALREDRLQAVLFNKFRNFEEGEWITDHNRQDLRIDFNSEQYKSGFHIFENKEDAQTYLDTYHEWLELVSGDKVGVLRKVRYRNVCARGEHSPLFYDRASTALYYDRATVITMKPCVVAREMFIEPEEKQQCA